MTKADYADAYQKVRAEFEELTAKRTELTDQLKAIEERMVHVRRGVIAMAALAGESVDEVALGLTESIRTLLVTSEVPLTSQQVIDGIAALGFDLSTQKNAGASITTVLMRLVNTNEIRRVLKNRTTPGGPAKTIAYWVGPKVPAAALT